jgi:hypothetical protein
VRVPHVHCLRLLTERVPGLACLVLPVEHRASIAARVAAWPEHAPLAFLGGLLRKKFYFFVDFF